MQKKFGDQRRNAIDKGVLGLPGVAGLPGAEEEAVAVDASAPAPAPADAETALGEGEAPSPKWKRVSAVSRLSFRRGAAPAAEGDG